MCSPCELVFNNSSAAGKGWVPTAVLEGLVAGNHLGGTMGQLLGPWQHPVELFVMNWESLCS